MSKENFKKVKIQKLLSVIVHGGNDFGYELAKTLISQGGKVVIIDKFQKESKKFIQKLKKLGDVDFIDFSGASELFNIIGRIDYLFYLENQYLIFEKQLDSRKFLNESSNLTESLKAANKYGAKVALITSVDLNRSLNQALLNNNPGKISPYSPEELQRYAETLAAEYHDKSKLNVRILRAGTILGHNFVREYNPELFDMIEDSVLRSTIVIKGEGLNTHYLIALEDSVYATLKLTFEEGSNGEVITLANNFEYTTLSIAYKLLELNPNATQIKFDDENAAASQFLSNYTPAPNAENFGWKAKYPIEKTLYDLLTFFYSHKDKKWIDKPAIDSSNSSSMPISTKSSKGIKSAKVRERDHEPVVVKTALGRALDRFLGPFKIGGKAVSSGVSTTRQALTVSNISVFLVSLIIFALAFYYLLYPLMVIGVNAYTTYNSAKEVYGSLTTLEVPKGKDKLDDINEDLEVIDVNFNKLSWAFNLVGRKDLFQNSQQMLYGFKHTITGTSEMLEVVTPLADYIKEFEPAINFENSQPQTTREYSQQLQQLADNREKIDSASYNIGLGSSLIEDTDVNAFPTILQPYIVEVKAKNREVSNQVKPLQNIVKFLPELLGLNERQRYVILLQNPSEIRATGGWLSSVGVIAIERGQVRELKFDDIYNIDGLLRAQGKTYPAPQSMKEALNIDNWNLSLSNWEPDFPTSAENATFFMQESNRTLNVDGVISMDVTFIQRLLEVWGGVEVSGEEELVTSNNLYEKIFQIHNEFTPGSSLKSTFLANLANETLKKVLNSSPAEYQKISQAVIDSLESKNILLSFNNSEASSYFDEVNWDGAIEERYKSAPITVDWNWGANKANVFLDKNIDLQIEVMNENKLRYKYTIATKNNSETKTYPEGDYINFERIYLPSNSTIISTNGFDQNVYKSTDIDGYKIVSGYFNVPVGSTQRLELIYEVDRDLVDSTKYFPINELEGNLIFDLNIFKQPGTFSDSMKVEITFPDNWKVKNKGDMSGIANLLSIQTDQNSDLNYYIVWSK